MSGTGKSAVIQELASRGYPAHDLDTPEWSEWIDAAPSDGLAPVQGKDWVWRENRVRELLSGSEEGTLFISGCAENMVRLFPLIDCIILLFDQHEIDMIEIPAEARLCGKARRMLTPTGFWRSSDHRVAGRCA